MNGVGVTSSRWMSMGPPIVLPSCGVIDVSSVVAPTLEYVVASVGSGGFGGIGSSGGSTGISELLLAAIAPCVVISCVEDAFVGVILLLCMEVRHFVIDLIEFNIGGVELFAVAP